MARIIVIEDDVSVSDLIATILERDGHRVTTVERATDGLAAVRENVGAADGAVVVITDIFMSDRDGLELTAELTRAYPGIPVIAISGGGATGDASYLAAARAFGAVLTLPKPFRPRELRAVVDEALRM